MPHECVSCGEVFEDGADEVFDGCPDCGATKFFYVKEVTEDETPDAAPRTEPASESPPDPNSDTGVGVDAGVDTDHEDDSEILSDSDAEETPVDATDVPTQTARDSPADTGADTDTGTEPLTDTVTGTRDEADTRTKTDTDPFTDTDDDIVEAESEYEDSFGGSLSEEDTESEPTGSDTPSVTTDSEGRMFRRARPDEARRRLLDEFETIRIVEPGSYELNLMNLYEDEEKIIALQEDGKYQVSLPSTIGDD